VLVDIAAKVGLPAHAAREVIEKRTHQQVIDEHWAKSREYGVTGVPTFVIGTLGVVGAQPYEALEELVKRSRT
jgi:predicted DsbA family dithiol-disulfide isomerase